MKKIAIISPSKNAYSETFIQAHKNLLKGNIHYLYGGEIPTDSDKKGSLFIYFYKHNFLYRVLKILPMFIYNRFFKVTHLELLKFYLKNEKIESILIEYGTTASKIYKTINDLNIKYVTHFHGYDASTYSIVKSNEQDYKKIFSTAKGIISVSNVMKEKLIEIGCPEKKLIVNPCSPDNSFFNIQPEFTKEQFIAIGRYVDKKAPYYTILAFHKVLSKHNSATLIIAGEGELLNTCKNLVKYLNVEKNVIFPGIITPKEFKNYLRESLAFVQHSITADNGDMEGTPVAVLEASAAGLPVISTIHAGIPDVIIHNKTGLLVNEHDIDGMAKHMEIILNNIEYAKSLGMAGKKNIKENYTMEKHISNIQELL